MSTHTHDRHDCSHSHAHDQPCPSETEEEVSIQQEQEALNRIVRAFRGYQYHAELEVARWQRNYLQLSERHKALLPGQPAKFAAARQAVFSNTFFIKSLLQAFDEANGGPVPAAVASAVPTDCCTEAEAALVSPSDVEKVRYALKNVMRDWSEAGAPERSQSYGRIVAELQSRFADWPKDRPPPRVLVPGAGLGRLCLEIAKLGFEAEGNEFSYFMLLTSSFLLNHTYEANQFTIFPWALSNCNQLTDADQLRPVTVPDIVPGDMLAAPGLLSMTAGDFTEIYAGPAHSASFDCVATCFFIDTAHNIIEYMEIIWNLLKEGGVWINLGPLLYHWADSHLYMAEQQLSIELSLEDVERVAAAIGFQCLKREMVPAAYTANLRSMLQSSYRCVSWTMVKPAAASKIAADAAANHKS
ncbi:hypothetical protein WJX72_004761 [[Myrmecia] bisecta]|uniref:carnosine N-methyltransferase n=1 Tax=[Myrmecia] bisecta TaxID=41462 RepID=A0AAW1QR21_9CHLO